MIEFRSDKGCWECTEADNECCMPARAIVQDGRWYYAAACGDPSLRHVPLDILHDGADMVAWSDPRTVIIPPRGFVLGTTAETFRLDSTIASKLDGRSSIGRCALTVHITAGLIDAGYHGQITLELANLRDRPLILRAGMRVGQLEFHQLITPARRPYGSPGLQSRYQGQRGVTTSRLHEIHHP